MEENPDHTENPHTAIASENETEVSSSKKSTPTKRRRHRHRKFVPNFNIPGVHKIILNETTQHAIACIAGDNVTAEKPWINIDKELILDEIETNVGSSEFETIKDDILVFPGTEILMGYIPDESKDYDEFYVCVTEEATQAVNEIVEKMRRIQEEKLKNAVHKKIKRWHPLGSDKEVEETIIHYSRPLLEVEIESKYPILPFKIHFRLTKAQDMREGYMELRPSDDSLNTIYRKRIDAYVQVAPTVVCNEAQTTCTYPTNSFTQYEYEIPSDITISPECMKLFQDYMSQNVDSFCDILEVNGCINLYSNDYENLVLNPKYTVKVDAFKTRVYLSFIDMNLCGNKMISAVCWHPIWSGIAIISYVDIAPALYLTSKITTDEVLRAVHDTNPVLVWSFDDDLKPKLILETPREIYSVSCCPYDGNIIIGGCLNGQIIIWDITHKLNRVEEEEILTINQQKYREHMFSLMNWMKNIFDLALIRPTAISDLKYSHKGCVNSIFWMSPFHSVSKTGKITEVGEDAGYSLQLITSSEDGTVMIWDLLKKPVITPGGFKGMRKMHRLKKRPSALLVDESRFKQLHLRLKPIYKINIVNQMENQRALSISSFYARFFEVRYEGPPKENRKKLKLSERIIFKPILQKPNSFPRKHFFIGTMEGDFLQTSWEGQEFDSGEVVNFEDCQFINHGKYHDGPIVSIDYSPVNDTVLTIGGKVFALWREDFQNRPVLWRKSKSIYTDGSWFTFEKAGIKLVRIDGYIEIWTLHNKSKNPLRKDLTSNGAVSKMSSHQRKLKTNVFGFCDYRGAFRLCYTSHQSPLIIKHKEEVMSLFLTKEVGRKKAYLKWQSDWNQRHMTKTKEDEEKKEEIMIITEEPKTKKKKEEKKKVAKISPGERYMEVVQEQQHTNELTRIKNIILQKKQLDTEELLKQREPLRKLEKENEVKKHKQKNKLKEADKIFKDTVAMLFPDIIKEKPQPPPDPYEDCSSEDTKLDIYKLFHTYAMEAQDYVETHPFNYDFSWGSVLKTGRERRKRLDDTYENVGHARRYQKMKEQKAKEAKAAAAAAAAAAAKSKSRVAISQKVSSLIDASSSRDEMSKTEGDQ